ncbi:hypothetical protein NDU88_003950 [Pleurodeles waltl]|uniref:Uncharacterized protein n=1 Tax=Pleurodeles waltl TaxID=8319 RepID=A0AAV7RGP1_PLEWA|nr:hypothetical protein NDU88_003950 [Pleurodeles waltl]
MYERSSNKQKMERLMRKRLAETQKQLTLLTPTTQLAAMWAFTGLVMADLFLKATFSCPLFLFMFLGRNAGRELSVLSCFGLHRRNKTTVRSHGACPGGCQRS